MQIYTFYTLYHHISLSIPRALFPRVSASLAMYNRDHITTHAHNIIFVHKYIYMYYSLSRSMCLPMCLFLYSLLKHPDSPWVLLEISLPTNQARTHTHIFIHVYKYIYIIYIYAGIYIFMTIPACLTASSALGAAI